MAKVFVCRLCMVELERIALADGTAVRVCVACGVIGLEHELAGGAPLSSAGLPRDAKAGRKRQPRRAPGRKVQYMADELSADQIRLLLKLEPNATCGFLRTTYLSAWSTG